MNLHDALMINFNRGMNELKKISEDEMEFYLDGIRQAKGQAELDQLREEVKQAYERVRNEKASAQNR